ncbi:low affinity immunoglobulin gamma Fc region receptor II-like [Betta splendens]|uniref:low affinity immunoglobulin gamma Fc region receptor II-like n=1 Tax=Betta splendens TaxID=158456 RepID=UPI0010F6D383|nr:low affinity immunoglobulin gamma Fc region receptor II-like [Betta splendens]
MEITSFYPLMSAILSIQPDRTQFFRYEKLSVSCSASGNVVAWTVKRNVSTGSDLSCGADWGRWDGSQCLIRSLYPADTGLYWCESESGESSDVLSITVNADDVILEVPSLPVKEGDTVTLRCSHKQRHAAFSTSDFKATFYKDGVFIGTEPEGTVLLPSVSTSDQGFYRCEHPSKGKSPQSHLRVTGDVQVTHRFQTIRSSFLSPSTIACVVLLLVLYTLVIIVCVYGFVRWTRARRENRRASVGRLI